MKTCSKCKTQKDDQYFSKRSESKDGLKPQCKDCDRIYSQNMDPEKRNKRHNISRKKRIRKLQLKILEFLATQKCSHCSETDPVVMEFDHLNPTTKEISVSEAIDRCFSWKRVKAEIDKCQILCANCHRRKTAKDFNFYKSRV